MKSMCSRASTKSDLFTLGSRSGTIQTFFDDLENVSNSDFVGFFAPSSSRTLSGLLAEKCNVKKLAVIEEHNNKPKEEKKQQESVKKEEVNSEKQELNEERDFKKTFLDLAAVLAFFALAFAQQIVALPLRFSSSKKYLSKLLEHTAGYMMYFYCVVISGVLDDTCYGADLKTFKTYDDFTATLSKGRRRDIKTSVKKAEDILAGKGVLNVHYAVGEWKFGFEHVKIIWEHCIRSMSCADKAEMNGLPWWTTCPFCFVFELMMVMVFPMEITELRKSILLNLSAFPHIALLVQCIFTLIMLSMMTVLVMACTNCSARRRFAGLLRTSAITLTCCPHVAARKRHLVSNPCPMKR